MPHWLLINPNTSTDVTAKLAARARTLLPANVSFTAATARFGAPYIASEASYAVAGHAVLDAWQQDGQATGTVPHACLVGCFGDPGVAALQEVSGRPAIGLAEAAFAEAADLGRFVIVTGGARWAPMLRKLALTLNYGAHLAAIHTLEATGAELAADPAAASARLRQACEQALQQTGADAVILGGAGLTGLADAWSDALDVPLIDSVDAGVRQLAARAAGDVALPAPLAPHPDLLAWPDLATAPPFSADS